MLPLPLTGPARSAIGSRSKRWMLAVYLYGNQASGQKPAVVAQNREEPAPETVAKREEPAPKTVTKSEDPTPNTVTKNADLPPGWVEMTSKTNGRKSIYIPLKGIDAPG